MSQKEPWYKDGLQFTCTQCGNCCTGEAGVVWVDDDELAQIAQVLGKSKEQVLLMHTRRVAGRVTLTERSNGDCTFFDSKTRKCGIYTARPKQCRTWPFWNSNLATEADWKEAERDCPGAGQGAFVSLEEIQAQASVIDI